MMTSVLTQALATLISRLRPDWDHPGIVHAIRTAEHLGNPQTISSALINLAGNLDLRTPALLAQPGKHWAETTVANRTAPKMCPDHPGQSAWKCPECSRVCTAPPQIWHDLRASIPARDRDDKAPQRQLHNVTPRGTVRTPGRPTQEESTP